MCVRNKLKIKKGDKVAVISGRDKGKTGEVIKLDTQNRKVVVQGVNLVKKHQKPSASSQGGIIEKELPIHISNVLHLDPKDNKPTRIGYKLDKDGKKIRFAKKSGELLD